MCYILYLCFRGILTKLNIVPFEVRPHHYEPVSIHIDSYEEDLRRSSPVDIQMASVEEEDRDRTEEEMASYISSFVLLSRRRAWRQVVEVIDNYAIQKTGLGIRSLKDKAFKYTHSIDKIECSICLEKFVDNDEVNILECQHIFHNECISNWIKHKLSCPMCRDRIRI